MDTHSGQRTTISPASALEGVDLDRRHDQPTAKNLV